MAPFGRNLGGAGYVCLNVNNLPRVATRNVTAQSRTRDLLIASKSSAIATRATKYNF